MMENSHSQLFCHVKPPVLAQTIVGLNEGLIREGDKSSYLPLHHAAETCPDMRVLKHLMSVHPQTLIAMSSEGCLPLHLLMMHNFRPGRMNFFFNVEHLQCMTCFTNNGSK